MDTTEDECIKALREAASRVGESPTKAQYENLDIVPSASTILRVVGGRNEAKRRAGLETNPARGSRTADKPADVSIPDGTSWEDLTPDQRWHYKNVAWNTHRSLERRARHRAWLNDEQVARGGCEHCEEDDHRCLDFHHLEPAAKTMAVTDLVRFGYGKAKLRAELEQCIVVCANCHAKLHDSTGPPADGLAVPADTTVADVEFPTSRSAIRAWSRAVRHQSGCVECGEDDPRCLQFHHRETGAKTDSIGRQISDGRSFETIRSEVEGCDVLCANCHRKLHYDEPATTGENDRV